ncbi:hypothetical protein C8Q76DRAFT_622842 [Earliella scabrosa]|nr:hypothetical protein C8Q76DRAFT_622842 [Earliella scabrosa]
MQEDDSPEPRPRRKNQHKPLPPARLLHPRIRYYYALGLSDAKIANMAMQHFDSAQYGLSDSSVKRIRKELQLLKTRQQGHTLESIHQKMCELKAQQPTLGFEGLRVQLRLKYGIHARRCLVAEWCHRHEPAAVQARKQRKFKRYRFWTAGVNEIWTFDQHDKWGPRFGLWLHVATEPMSGEIKWLRIWWNNSNPRLITKYYLDVARETGAVPLLTQSDPGSENFGIANAHTFIRQTLDPTLCGTLQHRWMRKRMNIKPEIIWSLLGRQWKPGFENVLQLGVDEEWYSNPADPLEALIFRWLAIPWLQESLDAWRGVYNNSPRRANKHKVLPHGIPVLIAQHPHEYGVEDFKVGVPTALLDTVEAEWAPPNHPIFELVPPIFQQRISDIFTQIGSPVITQDSFWQVYLLIKEHFALYRQQNPQDTELTQVLATHEIHETCMHQEKPPASICGISCNVDNLHTFCVNLGAFFIHCSHILSNVYDSASTLVLSLPKTLHMVCSNSYPDGHRVWCSARSCEWAPQSGNVRAEFEMRHVTTCALDVCRLPHLCSLPPSRLLAPFAS